MLKILKLNNKPCEIEFDLECGNIPCDVMIVGYDQSAKRLCYFHRGNPLMPGEKKRMSMNVPFAPKKIVLWIYDLADSTYGKAKAPRTFKVKNLEVKKMKRRKLKDSPLDVKSKELVNYILKFCRKARPSRGKHKYKNYLVIDCLKRIEDDYTSARISIEDENPLYIQVDRSLYDEMSYPGRCMTLLHEISHKLWNDDEYNEFDADMHAASIMLYLGFPPLEVIYCFEILFNRDDLFEKRRDALLAHIDKTIKNYPEYYENDAK